MERKIEIPLSPRGAQSIVEEVGAIVGQHINMMDLDGTIIASTDSSRLGTLHQGARRLLGEGLKSFILEKKKKRIHAVRGSIFLYAGREIRLGL